MHLRTAFASLGLLVLAACASSQPDLREILRSNPPALLIGEQHDEPAHQAFQRQAVELLAGHGALAALAIEMAPSGGSTAGLPRTASEEDVRRALRWDTAGGWPWAVYGPAVMTAVGAGVPVVGANLPRDSLRAAMTDTSLDGLLPGPAVKAQEQAIRLGHCGLLPEHQIKPMTRVQIARDRAMASTLAQMAVPGKTVVLIAGVGHTDADIGVPLHLPAGLTSRSVQLPRPAAPRRDYCEDMRRSIKEKQDKRGV